MHHKINLRTIQPDHSASPHHSTLPWTRCISATAATGPDPFGLTPVAKLQNSKKSILGPFSILHPSFSSSFITLHYNVTTSKAPSRMHQLDCASLAPQSGLLHTWHTAENEQDHVRLGRSRTLQGTLSAIKVPREKLCRMLLASRPVKKLPRILQIAYFPEYRCVPRSTRRPHVSELEPPTTAPSTPPSVDYSSYIKYLQYKISRVTNPALSLPLVQQEIDGHLFLLALAVDDPDNPQRERLSSSSVELFDSHIRVALTWTLCEPVLEQIQSINIPLSDIDRYLSVVLRFRSLSSVNFIIDLATFTWLDDLLGVSRRVNPHLQTPEQLKEEAFDSMVRFVDEAARLFGKTLRRVECLDHGDFRHPSRYKCLPLVLKRVIHALPPLDHPRRLDEQTWLHFVTHLDSTRLDQVKEISTPGRHWGDDLLKAGQVWSRCRSLSKLALMYYPVPVSFNWAVKEKNRKQGLGQGQSVAPVRTVFIRQFTDKAVLDIDDFAVAFSDTLEKFDYSCSSVSNDTSTGQFNMPHLPISWTAGCRWTVMPVLKKFTITITTHDLALDPALLMHCPTLESITIHCRRTTFDPASLAWADPVQLPKLTYIKLQGASSQGFNMETFGSTPLVKYINLSMCSTSGNTGADPGFDYDPSLPNSPLFVVVELEPPLSDHYAPRS